MDPLLLAGGAFALIYLLRGKKKEVAVAPPRKKVVPPAPKPTPSQRDKKPSGHPPPYLKQCFPPSAGGGNKYNTAYWDAGGTPTARARVFAGFEGLGYTTPSDRDTMNALGPDAKLGGGDDIPNNEVKRFQIDYNAVSVAEQFATDMGGLIQDGLVGPCTLNGMKYVMDSMEPGEEWQKIVQKARSQ